MPQTRRIQKKAFVNKGTTYGELLTEGLDKVLEQIDPLGKDDIFLDVGSGKGKLVARIADVTDVGRSIGVEFVEDRHKEAVEKFGEKEGVEFYFGNVLKTDYIEAARSRGIKESQILIKHAMPNAFLPVLTIAGITIASLIGGALLIEVTFSWPGIAMRLQEAIAQRDYPVVQGVILY